MTYGFPTDVTNLTALGLYINSISYNMYGPALVFITMIITFLVSLKWGFATALAGSGFASFLATMFLTAAGLVDASMIPISVILMVVGFGLMFVGGSSDV